MIPPSLHSAVGTGAIQAPNGGPPNNWLSEFGGSAWELDEASGQYYYHAFLKEQPDLNWRNPDLVHAMHNVLRFWFDRGVDGYRIDVLHHLIEDGQARDNPPTEFEPGMRPSHALLRVHTVDQPEIQTIITGLRKVADEYPERVLIGEIHLPIERLVTYYGVELSGIHLPFNFNLIGAPWSAEVLREIIATYEAALPRGAWPNWVVGNHDTNRIASRVGASGARLAMMLLLTLRGTPTMYYGEEIGMEDVPIPPELCRIRSRRTCPASASAAIRRAHRCAGRRTTMPDSPPASPGCRSARTSPPATWRAKRAIRTPCSRSADACSGCGANTLPSRSAIMSGCPAMPSA